jgi:high affinity Mn2+ porin
MAASFRRRRRLLRHAAQRVHLPLWLLLALLSIIVCLPDAATAQSANALATSDQNTSQGSSEADQPETIFEHPESGRTWISGQINVIGQGHGKFPAKYSGANSLRPATESALSDVLTLYTGAELGSTTQVILDVESAGGHGISGALGLAGFTNLDVVRSPDLGQTPYLARFFIRRRVSLGGGTTDSQRGPLELATELPARRIDFTIGKLSLVDSFDVNAVGSDSHLQFMNWTVDNNGAYDYAANTRGYTWGAMVEFQDRSWALRFAEALMPKVANGPNLDADVARAHAENAEVEIRRSFMPHREGAVRLLSFVNHADMGDYRESIGEFRAGRVPLPDVTATRRQGRIKYGFGVNLEQDISGQVRAFARWGWNDGRTESFAYTEVDGTVAFGADLKGQTWARKLDKVGAAYAANTISGDHREYLALGGRGFQLGDGKLTYGREQVFEIYYTAHFWRGVFASIDLQHIANPGYNRDRGPVMVPSLRLHIDL